MDTFTPSHNIHELEDANKILKQMLKDSWLGLPTRKQITIIYETIDELIDYKKQDTNKLQEEFDQADEFRFNF